LEDRINPGKIEMPIVQVLGPANVGVTAFFNGIVNNDDTANKDSFVSENMFYFGITAVDQVFDVSTTGGITEFWFEVHLTNNSGFDWIGFHWVLGFGVGPEFQQAPYLSGEGLDFDVPVKLPTPKETGQFFSYLDHDDPHITWTDGTMPSGRISTHFFCIDVPDWLSYFPPASQTPNGYRFTLRAFPSLFGFPGGGGSLSFGLNLEDLADASGDSESFSSPTLPGSVRTLRVQDSSPSRMAAPPRVGMRVEEQSVNSPRIGIGEADHDFKPADMLYPIEGFDLNGPLG